jgi:hypothetical protein
LGARATLGFAEAMRRAVEARSAYRRQLQGHQPARVLKVETVPAEENCENKVDQCPQIGQR